MNNTTLEHPSQSIPKVSPARPVSILGHDPDPLGAVPFSLQTERVLIAWCKHRPQSGERLFCQSSGAPLKYAGLRQIVRRLARRAGFTDERCNLHSLRHFAAREYLTQGGSLPALARILGHKSINTTVAHYAV